MRGVYEAIFLTAHRHRIPVTRELIERCEYELERSDADAESVIDALLRGFRAVQ